MVKSVPMVVLNLRLSPLAAVAAAAAVPAVV